ncbi:MAG: Ig-like domain-containing protein [bacterium]
MRHSLHLATVLVALVSLGCGGGESPVVPVVTPPVVTPPVPVVASITVSGPARLVVTRTDTVRATPRTAAGDVVPGKVVTFTSSNPTAISVAADGAITGRNPGSAVISATVDGITGTMAIVASDASLTSLTINAPSTGLLVGAVSQFTLTGKDSVNLPVTVRTATWTSSNPSVATVSAAGVVTATGVGTATIMVEGITVAAVIASVPITVTPVPVARIVFAPYDNFVIPGVPQALHATAVDSVGNVLARPITFSTSNVDVATVDVFGLVTPQATGFTTITATSSGKSATANLFVTPSGVFFIAVKGSLPAQAINVWHDSPYTPLTRLSATTATDTFARISVVPSFVATFRVRADAETFFCGFGPVCQGVAYLLGSTQVPVDIQKATSLAVVNLHSYAANVVAQASVAPGAPVTVTWTFDETTQPFDFGNATVPAGRLFYTRTVVQDEHGTPVSASTTRLPNGTFQFTATFQAPSTAGPLYIQVEADGALTRLLSPLQFRGEALRLITVQ